MKLAVLLLFLLANSIGKPLKTVNNSTAIWDLVVSVKSIFEQPNVGKVSQSRSISAVDEFFGFKTAKKPKYEQKDNGISFLGDVELNITLPNGKMKLNINDPSVHEGDKEKSTSFCFKTKTAAQPVGKSKCPSNYCEVQFGYGVINDQITLHTILGSQTISTLSSSASVDISPNQMFVVGKESEAVTFCQFDVKEAFIPVKLVNKGDRNVTLEGAVIYNPANGENSLQIGSILGITAGVAGVIGVGIGIFLIVYCCFCKKKQPKVKASVHVDEKVTKNPTDELDKKENKMNAGESEKKDKKEQSKKKVDPKIEKEKAADKKELLSELSENPEKETLDWMTNEMKTFEKSDDSDSVNLLEAFCSERKRQERIHFLLPNGLYQRITEDSINITIEISRVMSLMKPWNPDDWEFTRLSEISADPINYLTALGIISCETEVVLHRFINLFSTTELNFSNILSYPKNFVDEVEKATIKYVKALKASGFEDGKLPPVKLVKELEKRKVMARMAACSIVLGPILDTFEFTFDNPVIFLAPFPFLMVLLIRKLVPCTMTANVYEVIRTRICFVLKSRKSSKFAPIFCCPHPIPAAAYAYYANKCESFEEPIWLIRAHNSIIKNQKSKEIWDKTISNARDASFGLVSNIKEWMEKNAEHEISTTAVEVKK